MAENSYFLAYTSYLENISCLSDAECGRLFKSLLAYTRDGSVPEDAGNEKFVFPGMKAQIDRDRDKYREKCRKLKENSAKRKALSSDDNKSYQLISIDANNKEKEKENKNKKENENKTSSYEDAVRVQEAAPTTTPTTPPPSKEEVEKYISEKGYRISPVRFIEYYTLRDWKKDGIDIIPHWRLILDGWQANEIEDKAAGSPSAKKTHGSFDTDDFFNTAWQAVCADFMDENSKKEQPGAAP